MLWLLQALPKEAEVVVVGAGVAGLACCLRLAKAGVKPLLLEAGDGVGGRVRTDEVGLAFSPIMLNELALSW